MAISYPLALPTSIGIANITLSANNAVAISQSPFTFKQQIVQHAGQRWTASVSIPPVRRDLAEPWVSFLLALGGPVGTFLLGDPNAKVPQGVSATFLGTPIITNQSGNSITVTGASLNKTNWLVVGDYIQIGTGSSATLHKVLSSVNTNASGQAVLDIWPAIRGTRSGSIVVNNTVGLFRLQSNSSSWSINDASVYGISFDCVEAIS